MNSQLASSYCFQAKFVEFKPLRAADVKIPNGVSFVIANSLVSVEIFYFIIIFFIIYTGKPNKNSVKYIH